MKEEILELHEADQKRWTVTTLAARFGVPRENVAGLLKLGALRRLRLQAIDNMDPETRKTMEELRIKSVNAWNALPSPAPMIRRRISTPRAKVDSQTAVVSSDPQSENKSDSDPSANDQTAEEEENVKQKSPWAEYIEQNYGKLEDDTVRRTSFAFIEVAGKGGYRKGGDKIARAIWIRDGSTGKIRMPDDEERSLLTNEVRVRDSKAFLTDAS